MTITPSTSGRIVGALVLLAFVVYGTGSALVDAGAGTPAVLTEAAAHPGQIAAGALLMFINCVVVTGIGIVAFPVLARHHAITAYAYLVTRVFEAVMLAVGIVFVLLLVPLGQLLLDPATGEGTGLPALARIAQAGGLYAYWLAMTGLALGSLLFCRVLYLERLVPRFLAVWGVIGYAVLATGGLLEILGYGLGLFFSVPGGLFELALGVLLLIKGFPAQQSLDRNGVAGQATVPHR